MDEEVMAVFGKVWPVHAHSLTRFLIECRRTFDGDLDMFLVLAVIGDRTYSQQHADPEVTYEDFISGKAGHTETIDINLRSIAEFSGVPRETVRRKLKDLMAKGWVTRNANGSLTATRTASVDLQPLTRASIAYVAGMLNLLKDAAYPRGTKARK